MNKIVAFYTLSTLFICLSSPANAQQTDAARIGRIEFQVEQIKSDVNSLRSEVKDAEGLGVGLFLFGIVSALWAQNSGRNPWLWFFLGLFFSVVTGLVLLHKNAQDRRMASRNACRTYQ